MFSNWEALRCTKCQKAFRGRKPADDTVDILCLECIALTELPVVNDGDAVPESISEEFGGGSGSS